jgi:hypothetical protein
MGHNQLFKATRNLKCIANALSIITTVYLLLAVPLNNIASLIHVAELAGCYQFNKPKDCLKAAFSIVPLHQASKRSGMQLMVAVPPPSGQIATLQNNQLQVFTSTVYVLPAADMP